MAKTPEIDLRENYGKNYFINGDMRIAQRGTSFPAAANDTFVVDRWRYNKVGAAVHTLTQDTDVPTVAESGFLFQNSVRMNLTTPDTSLAAGEFVSLRQQIEGFNWASIAQKACTLSFWVKATLTGTYCVSLENFVDRSFVAEYTINSANTWEYKTIIIPASPSAGTWNYTNGTGIAVRWTLGAGAGSTFIAPSAGSWQTGNYIATTNQVNGVNTGATDFRITGAMLNEGYEALPFRLFGGDIQGELAACKRYYFRDSSNFMAWGFAVSSTIARLNRTYPVAMRASPTFSAGPNIATDLFIVRLDASIAPTAITGNGTAFQVRINVTVAGGLTAGEGIRLENPSIGFIALDAEL